MIKIKQLKSFRYRTYFTLIKNKKKTRSLFEIFIFSTSLFFFRPSKLRFRHSVTVRKTDTPRVRY